MTTSSNRRYRSVIRACVANKTSFIQAIKAVRSQYGLGLKEAKDAVETHPFYRDKAPKPPYFGQPKSDKLPSTISAPKYPVRQHTELADALRNLELAVRSDTIHSSTVLLALERLEKIKAKKGC